MSAIPVAVQPVPMGRSVRIGLIAGAVSVYLCAVGIVGGFEGRNVVTGVVRLGRAMLILVAVAAGYALARPRRDESGQLIRTPLGSAVAGGATAGAVTGAALGALLLFIDNVEQGVFVALGRGLAELLSLGQSAPVGALLLVIGTAALGAIGGGLALLPATLRRPLLVGVAAVIGMSLAEPLLSPIFSELNLESGWLFESGGLAVTGAVVVFLVAAGISYLRAREGTAVRDRLARLPTAGLTSLRIVGVLVVLAILAVLPLLVGGFVSLVLTFVGLYVLLGLGLNIVVGYAGLLDLGYVAFFAVGAYTTAVLTSTESFLVTDEATRFAEAGAMGFWLALPIVVVVAVIIGLLIGAPVLRLRGDYLAIVTLGFGEIVRTLVLSDWLSPWLGGAQGVIQIPPVPPEAADFRDPQRLYYLILFFSLVAAYISYRLADSRVGRAWAAMREDEPVAEAMGVSVIKYKLLAFAMGAAIGCLGGAFFATLLGSIFPASFSLQVSINVLAVLVLGGMGSIPGVLVGSFVLVGLPELLREFREFRLLIFGAVLVAIMILKPEGLLPNVRRRRELHVEELEEEQYERRVGDEETGAPVLKASPNPEPPS
ncbi:MAG TPA: hypothetical protein VHL78_10980 [Actinomycetota bacterium]|nr:hypothetical protein [Actinomycetota bacterium]